MLLLDAYRFAWDVRPSWQPSADGYSTMMVNSRHVLDVLGADLPIEDVEPIHFVRVQQAMTKLGKTNGTVNRITSTLSVVIGEMVKHGYLAKRVAFSNLSEPRGKQEYYTEDEVKRMLSAAKQLDGDAETISDILFLAAKTGARQGEILKLKWEAVDFESNELTFFDTKNSDDRVLPMTPDLRGFLKRKYRQRVDDDKLFSIHRDTVRRRLIKIQKMAGVSHKKTFHSFRHTAATMMFAKGASLPEVKEVLGHRSTATSLRYAHATTEGKARALALL